MTRYKLDTNVISDLIRNPHVKAAKRIAKVGDNNKYMHQHHRGSGAALWMCQERIRAAFEGC